MLEFCFFGIEIGIGIAIDFLKSIGRGVFLLFSFDGDPDFDLDPDTDPDFDNPNSILNQ